MKIKLETDHILYNTEYSEGDVVEVTEDLKRRLIKLGVASPIQEPDENMAIEAGSLERRRRN